MMGWRKWLIILILLVVLKIFLVAAAILSERIGLGPDEAQYWTWSQQLAFGYYSKPPGIAWQIAVGTHLFGNTEWGVRSFSLFIGSLLPFIVYGISRSCSLKPREAFWAALTMLLTPFGLLASLLAITDVSMVLFWTLAIGITCHRLNQIPLDRLSEEFPYYSIGFILLCGALFKWPIYLFWLMVGALFAYKKKMPSKHLLGGIFVSVLAMLPTFVWNAQNDFPTFKHVFSTLYVKNTVDVGATMLAKGNFLEFFGAQGLLLSPILFILFVLSFIYLLRNWNDLNSSLQFCAMVTWLPLFCLFLISFFKKLQGNWGDFIYPSSCVLIAWYVCQGTKKRFYWFIAGLCFSLAIMVSLYLYPYPLRHNLGWKALRELLVEEGYDPQSQFLSADKYQVTSILSFYAPEQKRAYFLNLQGIRKNQFSYWPGMEVEQVGKNGFFVTIERPFKNEEETEHYVDGYKKQLTPYFSAVAFLGSFPLVEGDGKPTKVAYLFKVDGYNGKLPQSANSY